MECGGVTRYTLPDQSTLMLDFVLCVIKCHWIIYNWRAAEGQKNVPLELYFIPWQGAGMDWAVVAHQSELEGGGAGLGAAAI